MIWQLFTCLLLDAMGCDSLADFRGKSLQDDSKFTSLLQHLRSTGETTPPSANISQHVLIIGMEWSFGT